MSVWTIVLAVLTFLGGSAATWAFNKFRRNKAAEDAEGAVKDSKDNDSDREDVLKDIDSTIETNKKIREKIKKMLDEKR